MSAIHSRQFKRVRSGDVVWIAGNLDDRFVCIGFVIVDHVRSNLDTWVIHARDAVIPRALDLTDEWKGALVLERAQLDVEERELPDGQQLQSMRELGVRAERWLEKKWADASLPAI